MLSPEDMQGLVPAETARFRSPIPDEMRRKYGFAPLGAADGPVKSAVFGDNSARLYHFTRAQKVSLRDDAVSVARAEYDLHGEGRTNLRYGYMQARVG